MPCAIVRAAGGALAVDLQLELSTSSVDRRPELTSRLRRSASAAEPALCRATRADGLAVPTGPAGERRRLNLWASTAHTSPRSDGKSLCSTPLRRTQPRAQQRLVFLNTTHPHQTVTRRPRPARARARSLQGAPPARRGKRAAFINCTAPSLCTVYVHACMVQTTASRGAPGLRSAS